MLMINDCRYHLVMAGIPMPDADELRRIAMTLHRWHEMECGNSNDHYSWCLVRGAKNGKGFDYSDTGKPFIERHGHKQNCAYWSATPDRERGALKRLAAIMARYPGFGYYVQGDPRGASLYILRPGDVPAGENADSFYSRGIAVYK